VGSGGITLTDSSCLLEWRLRRRTPRQTPDAMRFASERGIQFIAFDDAEMSDSLLKIAENPPGHFSASCGKQCRRPRTKTTSSSGPH
jgi:hypothetical protein